MVRRGSQGRLRRRSLLAVLIAVALALPCSATPLQAAGEPTPPASTSASLAPLDTEAFRDRYGQEALFRLRLGVDASGGAQACAPDGPPWRDSEPRQRFEQALAQRRWYEAGRILGQWRRLGCP